MKGKNMKNLLNKLTKEELKEVARIMLFLLEISKDLR